MKPRRSRPGHEAKRCGSDILAELDLPLSGINNVKAGPPDGVLYPSGVQGDFDQIDSYHGDSTHTFEGRILLYYSCQIVLRSTLNIIQSLLYPPDGKHAPRSFPEDLADQKAADRQQVTFAQRDECVNAIENWRKHLQPQMQWNDEDSLPQDINDARLRAKYYGAQYIIHRPFLNYALHNMTAEQITPEALQRSAIAQPSTAPRKGGSLDTDEVLRSCRLCIEAAKHSTIAFDGVPGRLIVTNIFGTAHA
jgi:hypothetical protein